MTGPLNAALGCYLAALSLAGVNLAARRRVLDRLVAAGLAAGVLALIVFTAARWRTSGQAPFSNMFESLVLMAWAIPVVFLALQVRLRAACLGAPTALLASLTLAYASTYASAVRPLMPALRSNWLTVHVVTCFLGYAGLAVGCAAAIGTLAATRHGRHASPAAGAFEAAMARTTAFGFFFLSVGIVTGAVWANVAWGTYWSWDPKETWALITWLIYAMYLHSRRLEGGQGRPSAWLAVAGFAAVLFTYFGVNALMRGLHSYAGR